VTRPAEAAIGFTIPPSLPARADRMLEWAASGFDDPDGQAAPSPSVPFGRHRSDACRVPSSRKKPPNARLLTERSQELRLVMCGWSSPSTFAVPWPNS